PSADDVEGCVPPRHLTVSEAQGASGTLAYEDWRGILAVHREAQASVGALAHRKHEPRAAGCVLFQLFSDIGLRIVIPRLLRSCHAIEAYHGPVFGGAVVG